MKRRRWLRHCKAYFWLETGRELDELDPAPPLDLAYDRGMSPERYAESVAGSLAIYWPSLSPPPCPPPGYDHHRATNRPLLTRYPSATSDACVP